MKDLQNKFKERFPIPSNNIKSSFKPVDFDSIFEKFRLPCATIEVDVSLSEKEKSIKRQIIMQETKERTRIENPKLYEFCYENTENSAEIAIPPHLHFGQIPSFIENVQYQTCQKVKHNFEEEKKMLQEIPWNQVPIPEPKVNLKFKQQNVNRQKEKR